MTDPPISTPQPPEKPEGDDPEQLSDDLKILLVALDDPQLYEEFGDSDTPPELPAVKPYDTPPTTPTQ